MKIIKDKQLIEDVFQYNLILYGMGINNAMNKGFAYDIALNFPEVKISENASGYGDLRKYGKIRETKISPQLSFCACYCYNIGFKQRNNGVFIDYQSLEKSLEIVRRQYKNKKIACPIIGQDAYDGNGDKDKIIDIFKKVFGEDSNIVLYDFVQQDFRKERYKEAVLLHKDFIDGKITKEEFIHLKKLNEWKRCNGIFQNMPEEFEYKPKRKAKNKFYVKKN